MTFNRTAALALPAALVLLTSTLSVQANPLKKHPHLATAGAGLMAHHMAKKSAAHGGHGMMARHPMLTGVAAAGAMHHMTKKH
jgi:hypothetical protein